MIDLDVILLGLSLQDASGLDGFQRLFDAQDYVVKQFSGGALALLTTVAVGILSVYKFSG